MTYSITRRAQLSQQIKQIEDALNDLSTAGGLTVEQVDDRVASLLVAGSNITLTYNDTLNTLTIASSGGGGGGNSYFPSGW
ncbi:hypothetical protein UFOVP353_3 [uncultured Caudovirales phage]|uniref:Uncharacterized protein n=1 Tax=uncultured Caudovirales phage TaxID=2100421 RepID=A0A6J5M2F7_9CAUD|nr:hypothetical protein UFOVP353_3 [uncultured Caudovirales phage]